MGKEFRYRKPPKWYMERGGTEPSRKHQRAMEFGSRDKAKAGQYKDLFKK